MSKKMVITSAEEILAAVEKGDPVYIGQYAVYSKEITPSDRLVKDGRGLVQVGVERKGTDFVVKEEDIHYTARDTQNILEHGQNLNGGNVALVCFQYVPDDYKTNKPCF